MEERILKKVTITVMLMCIMSCAAALGMPQVKAAVQNWFNKAEEERTREERKLHAMSGVELLEYNNKQAGFTVEEGQLLETLRIELPLGVSGRDIKLEEDILRQEIRIRIPYAGEYYMYEYPTHGHCEGLERLDFESETGYYGDITLQMDRLYEVQTDYDREYFFIQFLTPHEVYDKVIVVDAGHGGQDTGTVKQGVSEKDINLDIVLKLKELFGQEEGLKVGVYYTRTQDTDVEDKLRAKLPEKAGADLYLGIYGNATKSGMMSSINGTQVMYCEQGQGSQEFARLCLDELTKELGSSDKGLVAAGGEDLIYGCKVPAALVWTGFMTNQEELSNLCSQEYQQKAAEALYRAVMQALREE